MANISQKNGSEVSDTMEVLEMAVNVGIVPILVLFGTLGNVLSFVVLGHDLSMKKTARILHRGLAVADTANLLMYSTAVTLWTIIFRKDWIIVGYFPYLFHAVLPLCSATQMAAIWMICAVTADKYVAICWPLYALRHSSASRARTTIACIWIFSCLYCIPRYFEFKVEEESTDNSTHNATLKLKGTNLWADKIYFVTYSSTMYIVINICIPIFSLMFFNIRLLQAIYMSNQNHHIGRNLPSSKRNIVMVSAMVTTFILCAIPSITDRIHATLHYHGVISSKQETYNILVIVGNLGMVINSSTNFILYYFFGQRFRSTFFRVVCPQYTEGAQRPRSMGSIVVTLSTLGSFRHSPSQRRPSPRPKPPDHQ